MRAAFADGLRSVAIVFVHGYRYPEHEAAAAAIADEIGFTQVSVSHEVSPLDQARRPRRHDRRRRVPLADSAPLRRAGRRPRCPASPLYFMQSSGGLIDAAGFRGKDAILSGPAGGVVGMVQTAQARGLRPRDRLRHGRHLDRRRALRGRARACVRHAGRGRARAGADDEHPHRRRGRRLDPHVRRRARSRRAAERGFRSGAGVLPPRRPAHGDRRQRDARQDPARVLSRRCSVRAATKRSTPTSSRRSSPTLADEIERATGTRPSPEAVAEGFVDVAVGAMANAVKKISVARGYDVTRYALQCYGGAGGQHACAVADALGIETVLVHPLAGVLSAYGMGLADQSVMRETSVEETAHRRRAGDRAAGRGARPRGGRRARPPGCERRPRAAAAARAPALRGHRLRAGRSVR